MTSYRIRIPILAKSGAQAIRALGIDLGTTNSVIAQADYDRDNGIRLKILDVKQELAGSEVSSKLVPSAIAATTERMLVGTGAVRARANGADLGLREKRDLFFECKNDMGTQCTYHEAPKNLRTPSQASAMILRLLYDAARTGKTVGSENQPEPCIDQTVVTVPASFQIAQREATMDAARMAGLRLDPGNLLDEPIAAFTDYVFSHADKLPEFSKSRINLLVFDFGGGTCDVAALRLGLEKSDRLPQISPLAVSRYHRLGGSDIDRAIVHEVLIPELARQNQADPQNFDYELKKELLEPALLDIAEKLKIALCNDINRSGSMGKLKCQLHCERKIHDGTTLLTLTNPTLTQKQLDSLMEPFLDHDLLYARETEYRITASIFGPIQDCLERARLRPRQIDLCLAVGGSCLIPQVMRALRGFMPKAKVVTYDNPQRMQFAVACGAAYHSIYRKLTGKRLVPVVCNETIYLATQSGRLKLIPAGTELPAPVTGKTGRHSRLVVPPQIAANHYRLRVQVVAGTEKRHILTRIWQLDERVSPGDILRMDYSMDENQCLRLEMSMDHSFGHKPFNWTIDNPLTNVVNPNQVRMQIREKEELAGAKAEKGEVDADDYCELARLHHEIEQNEKAVSMLRRALRLQEKPDSHIIGTMAMYVEAAGNGKRAERLYLEAARVDRMDGTPLFNYALLLRRKGRNQEALEAIRQATNRTRTPEYLCLEALILFDLRREQEAQEALAASRELFALPEHLSDWSLGWYSTAAAHAKDHEAQERAAAERMRRTVKTTTKKPEGCLPRLEMVGSHDCSDR